MYSLTSLRRLFRRRPRVGLALGGGGARGLAHIGVLNVMEGQGIPIDLIVGTSMGAIVGGAYAQEPAAKALEARVIKYLQSLEEKDELATLQVPHPPGGRLARWANSLQQYYFLTRSVQRSSLIGDESLKRMISFLLDDSQIENSEVPFAAVAVDLLAGETVTFTYGPIRQSVKASATIPGVFAPVEFNGRLLIDGGVSSLVPVEETRQLGADVVVAVDVSPPFAEVSPPKRGIDLLLRADEIARVHLKRLQLCQADVLIQPQVGRRQWFEFSHYQGVIESGAKATQGALPQIRQLVR